MASYQQYICMGNLTRNPETRMTSQGMMVTEFSVAVNIGTKDKPDTFFAEIIAFGKLAEQVSTYLRKGNQAFVVGKLKEDRWTDAQGQKKSRIRVYADTVRFPSYSKEEQHTTQSQEAFNPNPFAQQVAAQPTTPPMPPPPQFAEPMQEEIPF